MKRNVILSTVVLSLTLSMAQPAFAASGNVVDPASPKMNPLKESAVAWKATPFSPSDDPLYADSTSSKTPSSTNSTNSTTSTTPTTKEGESTMHSAYDGYTFPLSEGVTRTKVHFTNRYGIKLTGDLYAPKDAKGKLPAIAVCGPFGAVKEQASGLYADEMATRGFITLAFDPSFIGESGGEARNVASPDINTEDFCAAVDFLSNYEPVDPEKIGLIGICGFGGMALNAAAMDTRIKATVTSTMYDMSRVNANGYFDAADNADARYEMKLTLNAQRTEDYKNGSPARAGGVADVLPDDAPFYVKDYFDYYKTERGYAERSLNSNAGWNTTSSLSFINMPILQYSDEIRSAVLVMHGEDAHSCYFSRDAFAKLTGDNKELLILPDTVHTDLYDKKDKIPFDKLESFFEKYLEVK